MLITKTFVADKIASYLHHDIALAQLVDWAERAMLEDEFDENGLKGFYSCTPNQFVLVSAEPSEQFFDFILGAKQANVA